METSYTLNRKDMKILLIVGSLKKILSQYLPPYRSSGGNVRVKLDLSSYATKTDFKNVTHVDVINFTLKSS